jgi:hypothetical protein
MSRLSIIAFVALLAGCARQGSSPMPTSLWPVRYISVSIDRPPGDVYQIAADPENLPRWAKGLAGAITANPDGTWTATSPMGKVTVRFADRNSFGVLDHDVTLPSGETVHTAMRVVPNARGSEVAFTLFRRPGTSDSDFESDARSVTRDLAALKALVER